MAKKDKNQPEISALEKQGEDKIRFLVWFSKALESSEEMKAHHMSAIQAYFKDIGLSEYETPEAFENALVKFGYRR